MSLQQIHPILITRDAGATIERTLESLRNFPEVIVYDNGSDDETLEVCAHFGNVRVHIGEFIGFGPTKAHAVSLASGDWVLSIDADEYLGQSLLQSLSEIDLSNERVAYVVERHNLFMGKQIRYGGWGNDWLVRLFNRRQCQFNDSVVHEKVVVPTGVTLARTNGALWHQAVTDINEFLIKINRYSDLEIQRSNRTHHPAVILLRALWASFSSYILRAGFLDGWRGLVIAYCYGIGCFFKHMNRYVSSTVTAAERTNLPD
jgi:glycosyltransferase involved in cell wall biosynthesis